MKIVPHTVEAGDAGAAANRAEYDAIVGMRDALKQQVAVEFAKFTADLDRIMAEDPHRIVRRRAKHLLKAFTAKRKALDRDIDEMFAKVVGNYDPSTGTLAGIQEEAAALIAAALKSG